jgi:hypothetical protein
MKKDMEEYWKNKENDMNKGGRGRKEKGKEDEKEK